MKKKDVQIGMKVVPHSKTALTNSTIWGRALDYNQNYLYVVGTNELGFILNNTNILTSGDYFRHEDFEPYIEKEFPLYQTKNDRRIDKLLLVMEEYKNKVSKMSREESIQLLQKAGICDSQGELLP